MNESKVTESDLKSISQNPSVDDIPKLLAEIQRLKGFVKTFGESIESQLDEIEVLRQALLSENQRLRDSRDAYQIERDACIGLLMNIAHKGGLSAGRTSNNQVAIDLPSGQVSWEIEPTEMHLFEALPEYTQPIEEMAIEDKYSRVMNPQLG